MRIPTLTVLLLSLLLGTSCKKKTSPSSKGKEMQRSRTTHPPRPHRVPGKRSPALARLVRAYLDGLFRAKPHLATFMGDHRFDSQMPDYSPKALWRRARELKAQRDSLAKISVTQLDDRIDADVLRDGIDLELLYLREIRDWTWDPRGHDSFPFYDPREIIASRLSTLIHGTFQSHPVRQRNVVAQLRALPRLLTQLRESLRNPAPVFVRQAIKTNRGRIKFFAKTVLPFLRSAAKGKSVYDQAVAALKAYQQFLENELLAKAKGDWRLGKSLFDRKFPLALQTRMTPNELLARAQSSFAKARGELFSLSQKLHRELWPKEKVPAGASPGEKKQVIRKVRDALVREHPKEGELVKAHAANLQKMRSFIQKHNLLALPPADTLSVEPMPAYKRGAAGAEYLSPGILNRKQRWKATYYVDPVDPAWPPKKKASYLRGNNRYQVQITAIHEAYPGHHTQFYYARQNLNPLRAVLWNAPMAEGWAVYAQEMMVNRGYGGKENDRYRFFELKVLMVVAQNAILDIKLQRKEMTDEQAVRMMTEEGFQQEAVARKKLHRAKLDSTQLSQYFLGLIEIQDLERRFRRRAKKFDQRTFNEALIGHGSLAIRHIAKYLGK